MTRYQKLHDKIRQTGAPIYSPYVMLGYPDADTTLEVCRTLIDAGVHALELGLPFRDPVADGPVVAEAGNIALDNGMSTEKAAQLVKQIRAMSPDIPLTLMCYYNMVLAKTAERFIGDFAKAGIDGILIPDLPPEQAHEIAPVSGAHGVENIFIVAPNSDDKRLALIAEHAGGFAYVLTRLGVTGINAAYREGLEQLFSRIKKHMPLPAFAGFGISEPDQAAQMVAAGADGVITGSRLIQMIRDNPGDLAPIHAHTKAMLENLHRLKVK